MLPGIDINLPQHLAMAGLGIDQAIRQQPALHLRHAVTIAGTLGCRGVHLDATAPGLKPRELDRSARRDVASAIRRQGLTCSGVDLLIPPGHFTQESTMSRAVDAAIDAIGLARELAGLIEDSSCVCCLSLPGDIAMPTLRTLLDQAHREDVQLAIEWIPQSPDAAHLGELSASPNLGAMLDCGRVLLAGAEPHSMIAKLGRAVACIRLSDADRAQRVPLGTGRLDRTLTIAAIQTCTKLNVAGASDRGMALVLDGAGVSFQSLQRL